MSLPLILAGPILRRVEPTLVTVWVALREPCTVRINIYNGLIQDQSSSTVFMPPANVEVTGALANTSSSIRAGAQLHIATATFKLPPITPLAPHLLYSYNITLQGASGTNDLKSLGLLKTGEIEGKPNLALGYATGFLPSFALPPLEITDLRLLHGSCRLINRNVTDGMAWVDDFVEEARTNPKARPHQLLLSGDQIYADDVDASFLHMIMVAGEEVLGSHARENTDRIALEQLPTLGKFFPSDEIHFPPGYRYSLTLNEARLTSVDGTSHLLGFNEFCAMYLMVWCNACWPDKLPTEQDLMHQLLNFGWLGFIPGDLRTRLLGKPEKETPEKEKPEKPPPEIEKLIDYFRTGDLPAPLMQTVLGSGVTLPKPFDADEKKKKLKERAESVSKSLVTLKQLWEALPKVRRGLANVPTYMMFDDHEVTDDWYLNPMWRDRVLTNPLGRTVIRNALVAYALFQGWGNDPIKFESGNHKQLLDETSNLFPPETVGPDETVGNRIDTLLGFNLPNTTDVPPVTWHYSVKGSRHLLVALDNRTRRTFVSRIGPPGNIGEAALKDQIPAGPLEAGLEVLVLVAPLPVVGPPVFDELVAPLVYRIFDAKARNDLDKFEGPRAMAGTNPDAIEAWAFDPIAFESLLKRLEPYRRVVILSGDVHNGSSQSLSYWKKGDTEPAVFAQFTSSGVKNVMPWYLRFIDRTFATAQRIVRANIGTERLGWNVANPTPLTFPADAEIASALLSRLRHEPIHIPGEGWPENTTINRPPDFQWRATALRDQRLDGARPEPAKVEPFNASDTDITPNLDGYRQVVVRHAQQLTRLLNSRQILIANNIGRVRFETENNTLVAVQELFTTFPFSGAETLEKPSPFTLHRVPLSSPSEEKPEAKFAG